MHTYSTHINTYIVHLQLYGRSCMHSIDVYCIQIYVFRILNKVHQRRDTSYQPTTQHQPHLYLSVRNVYTAMMGATDT